MVTAIVYRKLPGRPKRQYVFRIIDKRRYFLLWRTDRAVALPMERDEAKELADALWLRSRPRVRPYRAFAPIEPAGEYGTEEWTA